MKPDCVWRNDEDLEVGRRATSYVEGIGALLRRRNSTPICSTSMTAPISNNAPGDGVRRDPQSSAPHPHENAKATRFSKSRQMKFKHPVKGGKTDLGGGKTCVGPGKRLRKLVFELSKTFRLGPRFGTLWSISKIRQRQRIAATSIIRMGVHPDARRSDLPAYAGENYKPWKWRLCSTFDPGETGGARPAKTQGVTIRANSPY